MELTFVAGVGVAALGLILGSFLNALLFRYNTGRSVARGRSRCMHCSHELAAVDLVPLLSYLFLRGKCRYCTSRVSLQYPLVEAAAAALSVAVYLHNPEPMHYALGLVVWITLLFVVVYDSKHKIIPWEASLILAVAALVGVYLSGATVWALAAGPLLAAPLLALSLISGGRWMGFGDGILEVGLGWLLGLSAGLTAFMLSFWSGAIVGIVLMLLSSMRPASTKTPSQGGYTMKSEVPFAPFLIFGAGCAYFLNVDFFQTVAVLFR